MLADVKRKNYVYYFSKFSLKVCFSGKHLNQELILRLIGDEDLNNAWAVPHTLMDGIDSVIRAWSNIDDFEQFDMGGKNAKKK